MSIHDGHRQRRKELFRSCGLGVFADHEVLELLLFYAIPRQDTNEIAHRLMKHFGSLSAVFTADAEELRKVEGVGESAATLLSLLLPVFRRVQADSAHHSAVLNSSERSGAYFLDLFFGERQEVLYEACLDAKGKLLACRRVAEGGADSLSVNMRAIVENALAANASNVILAHNHPSGIALASDEDLAATRRAAEALESIGVTLADHIIVADGDFVSLRDSGELT